MGVSERAFAKIAAAILEGKPFEWPSAEAGAETRERELLEELRVLSNVVDFHRLASKRDLASPAAGDGPVEYWGRLRLIERVGGGTFGDVYRAWDPRLDREVALKLIPAQHGNGNGQPASIIREGRLLARVRHPGVVTIHDAEEIDGQVGLCMEFVDGPTLEQQLDRHGPLTAAQVIEIGIQLCEALSAVHRAGVLHRDVKATNVVLKEGGRVVLMDFGAGRHLDDALATDLTGTPLCLAPEVLEGGEATVRSDIYSLGVLLHRMVTGSYPVQAASLAELRLAHARRATGDRTVVARTPAAADRLGAIIQQAIDPRPDARPETVAALANMLRARQRRAQGLRWAYAVPAAVVIGLSVAGLALSRERPEWFRSGAGAGVPPTLAAAAHAAKTPAIAVLPFVNASSDPGNDDFIEGLTSEVIRNLAVIDGLQVRSQTSSFFFKDRPRDMREVARQLHVGLVVEAYVQRIGNRLRVHAQLVRVPDDVPVWSNRFDRTLGDVFAIQDEISLALVNELRLTLGRGQRRYQTSLAAYDLYLRGRALVARLGTENSEQAVRLFEQVIAIDPGFAPAHAGLADAYAALSWALEVPETSFAGMRPAAVRALQIDPELAEAHAAMGVTYAHEFDWENATSSFERAIKLNPNLSEIRISYASTLLRQGKAAQALGILAGATEMAPFSLAVKRQVAIAHFQGERYEEVIRILREVVAADPDFTFAANLLARALTFAGRPEEAIALWESRPQTANWERWLISAYVKLGRRADVDRLLNLPRNAVPYRQALNYAALGDKERTFEALSRAAVETPVRTAAILAYPELSLLRGDPRLDQLRKRFNLR